MKMSRKDQLKKLKMPKESAAEADAGSDLDALTAGEEGSPEEEASETPAEEKTEVGNELAEVSDEDLIAELHKRGLIEGGPEADDSLQEPSSDDMNLA